MGERGGRPFCQYSLHPLGPLPSKIRKTEKEKNNVDYYLVITGADPGFCERKGGGEVCLPKILLVQKRAGLSSKDRNFYLKKKVNWPQKGRGCAPGTPPGSVPV